MKNFVYIMAVLCCTLGFSQSKEAEKTRREVGRLVSEAARDYDKDHFATAEAKYRTAISRDGKQATAKFNLGNAYYEKEKNDEALQRFVQAAEVAESKDEKHKAFHNLGNAMMNQKNYAGAVEAYKNALRNNPRDQETRYNFALAKKMLEQNPQDDGGSGDEQDQEEQPEQNQSEQEQDDSSGDSGENDLEESDSGEESDENQEGNDQPDQGSPDEQQGDDESDSTPQPVEGQLSPQQIESLLEAMNNEEKKVQDKINAEERKGTQVQSDKDW